MGDKIELLIEENRYNIARWETGHNHKENVAYLSIPFNAILLSEAFNQDSLWLLSAYVAGMCLCHFFLCDTLRQKRRMAIRSSVAAAINDRLRHPREEGLELLEESPEKTDWPPLPRFWFYIQHVFPTCHVDMGDLVIFQRNAFYERVAKRQVCHVRCLRLDWIPAIGSLGITLLGSARLAGLVIKCLWP